MEVIENEENHPFYSEVLDAINSPIISDDKAQNQPTSPGSQPSIDFSAATPDSKTDNNFLSDPLPFSDLLDAHDTFDLNESLDLFSNGGHMDDENSISDISDDGRPKQAQKKNKHTKVRKAPIVKEKVEETAEVRKISVVETEIDVVKKLENGPSAAELRRRNLIEIDQDELEERVEKLNKVTLQVMTKSLGLSKTEQLQRIIECRLFLKQYWDDSELGDFIEETMDKTNNRIYGTDAAPAVDAMDYLDRDSYSDDDWVDEPDPEAEGPEEAKPIAPAALKEDNKPVDVSVEAAEETKEGLIVLEESEDEEDELEIIDNNNVASSPNAASGPVATAVVTPVEAAARVRLAELERQRLAAAARESAEVERRKQLFLAANKAPKHSRAALLIALRQKVHQTAKENYCNQRKIQTEHLSVKLQIAEKCRQLVELLKERHETRVSIKREARKAKYQQQADADEEEFDENDSEFLGEGQFLTAEEKEALLRGGDSSSEDEEEEEVDGMDVEEEEGDRVLPLDEERMGMAAVTPRENAEPADSDRGEDIEEIEEQDASSLPDESAVIDAAEEDEEEMEMKIARIRQHRAGGESTDGIRRYGSARVERAPCTGEGEAVEEENTEMDLDADSVADTVPGGKTRLKEDGASVSAGGAVSEQKADDAESVAGQTTASAYTQKSGRHKKKSTGNALYRLALEEEERRSRRKGNALLEDEAAEEEEEGMQAGLGDFGFGVTSNIRERDEEVNALKLRKGDFDHIVDDVSDGEGDEAAGAVARAEMELQEDRARDRAIITAVTEGHDAMRKMQKKGKYTFDKLVGEDVGSSSRRGAANVGAEEPAEEEYDEEEMLQRGFKDRFDREYQTRARRGRTGDSDSDSAGESDTDENLLEQLDTSDMTEEQKAEEMERIQRLREKNRQDALMAKQRIQSYKMARERARQEKMQRQMQQQASSQGGVGAMSLLRQDSMGSRPALSLNLTLEPLHDQYSRLLMNNEASALGASSSNSNLFAPAGISPRDPSSGVPVSRSGSDGKLADITNLPHQHIKRRTAQAPKHAAVVGDKRTMRRSHTVDSARSAKPKDAPGGLYRSELNRQEVEEGFGMGMALPSSARNSAHTKTDVSGGLFSAVTGLRRFGDLGKSATNSNGASSGSNSLRKRTFSEVGKLHSTVAAQQFVFAGVDESSQQFSRHGDNSTSGFGASRSASVTAGSSRPRLQSSSAGSAVPSLFAQLGAKRGAGLKASGNK